MNKKFKFTPPEGFESSSSYPNPTNEREVREQLQRPLNQIKDFINNEVSTEIKKPISSDLSVDVTEQEDSFDLSVKNYVKQENDKVVAKVENLIVTTTANPLSPDQFVCDYSSDEIRNALIQNKTVVMYFEDNIERSGNQVYPFLKMTSNGAYFRRCQATEDYTRQIDIKVDYAKNVTFTETRFTAKDKENYATIKAENISEITDVETFRTYFYNLRKSQSRKWQFEVSQGNNENIIQGIGGLPNGVSASDKAFIYVDIPYSEAGGFTIEITYQGRTNGKLFRKVMYSTLNSNWHETRWLSMKDQVEKLTSNNGSIRATDNQDGSWNIEVSEEAVTKVYEAQPTPPTDTEVLWVDTDDGSGTGIDTEMSDTSENPVQNKVIKEYVDNHSEGEYELIETITMTEDAVLNRTQEPDGTPYKFEKVKMLVVFPAETSGSKYLYMRNEKKVSISSPTISSGTFKNVLLECEIINGISKSVTYMGANKVLSSLKTIDNEQFVPSQYISEIFSYLTLPKGTTIEIWGVRA